MSQISAIFGTDDDAEIVQRLYLIANVSFFLFFLAPWVSHPCPLPWPISSFSAGYQFYHTKNDY
jgi:hypothetical protein